MHIQLIEFLLALSGKNQSVVDKLTDQQGLLPLMGKLTKEFKALLLSEFKKQGIALNKEQFVILKILKEKANRPQNDLAIVTARDKTSLTRLLSNMEKKGLITRLPSEEDKRINLISPTTKGQQMLKRAIPVAQNLLTQAIQGIDHDRIESAKSLILDIYSNLNKDHECK